MDHDARRAAWAVWVAILAAGLYLYFFRHDWLRVQLSSLAGTSLLWIGSIYLILGCLRAFTLVPATYLLFAGMLVLPPSLLFLLTLAGIIVSSAAVYRFAGAMGLAAYFERHHAEHVGKLRRLLQRRELPIVIGWSFLPIAPTDVVCYVCGALAIDLRKCLLGVAIGEGAICAIYVWAGTVISSRFSVIGWVFSSQ